MPRDDDAVAGATCAVETLRAGEVCPFCGFATLVPRGLEVVCPICGYGLKPCT